MIRTRPPKGASRVVAALAPRDREPTGELAEAERFRRARLVFTTALVLLCCVPVYAAFFWNAGVGLRLPTLVVLAAGVGVLPVLPLLGRVRRLEPLGNWVVMLLWMVLVGVGLTTEGTTLLWVPALPLLALLLAGRTSALCWAAVSIAHILAFHLLDRAGRLPASLLSPAATDDFLMLGRGSLVLVLAAVGLGFESAKNRAMWRENEKHQLLRASEARFRSLIEQAPDAVAVCRERRLVYANGTLLSFLGQATAEALVGRPLAEFVIQEDRHLVESDGAASGQATRLEVRFSTATGPRVGEVAQLALDFDGHPATLAVIRDVTERRALLAHVAQMDRLAAVGTLAAGVGHEINNPLTYVMANLRYVREELAGALEDGPRGVAGEPLPPGRAPLAELIELLGEAHEGAERIRRIVLDLRTFSRAQPRGDVGLVDLRRVLEFAAKIASNEIRHRARFATELADAPPVRGDESRITQVIVNLLVNAAQAIPEGAAETNDITLRLYAQGAHVLVEVRDTGAGIPPKHLQSIFDPFFTTKLASSGTGLGLSVSQEIVRSLGGEIRVESQPGHGSVFTVLFPAGDDLGAPATAPPPAASPRAARRGRVLAVDDEPAVCRAVTRLLQSEYEIVAVSSAREALRLLDAGPPFDAVICDLMMPELTGVDFHEQLTLHHPEQAARVLFLTGGSFTSRSQEFLERPGTRWMSKPVDAAELRAVLRELVPGADRPTEPIAGR